MSEKEKQLKETLLHMQDKNIFILAGAGAGKSTLMVDRLIAQAASGKQPFKETVAITFTNKAAMELEEKLMRSLDRLPELETREMLMKQKSDLTIDTIHSFCQKMLQEKPIEAGLSPNFTVIEEGEAQALFHSVVLDVFYGPFAGKVDEIAYLEEKGHSIESYISLLYSQALYSELGTEEKPFFKEAETMEHDHASFVEEIKETIVAHAKHLYMGITFKGIKSFKKPNKDFMGLSLKELIIAYWNHSQTMIEVVTRLFTKEDADKLIKRLENIYSEVQMMKQVDIDVEPFCQEVEMYIYERFEEKVKKLLEKEALSVTTIFDSKVQEDLFTMDDGWTESFHALLEERNVEALFAHLFGTPLKRLTVRDLLTDTNKSKYDEIDIGDLDGLSLMLTDEGVYSEPAIQSSLGSALSVYRKKRYIYQEEGKEIKRILQSLFQFVMESYKEEKLQRNVVTNNDLLKKTYDLLHNEEVRQYFHEKYRYIYVDECQDTDPLQTKILFYLTAEKMPTSMEDAIPWKGSLFMVGDPKQSIYRFRNADLRIYEQLRNIASQSDDWFVATLQLNYRSHPRLIDWFNQKFLSMFVEEPDLSIQPDYEDMKESKECNSDEPVVYKLASENEAENIATWIAHRKQTDPEFQYDDVLIITPKNDSVKVYIDHLKKCGIPTSFSGSIVAKAFPEIIRLVSLIDYVAGPTRFKRLKVLAQNWHIPFSLMHQYEECDEAGKNDAIFAPIHLALERLHFYVSLARQLSPVELMTTLVYEQQVGIFDPEITVVDYRSARAILTTFIEKARQIGSNTVVHLATQLKGLLEEPIEYELQADDSDKAVQIMNLHKTKGLEGKIVFLVGPEKRKHRDDTHVLTRNDWEEEIEFALFTRGYPVGRKIVQYYTASFYEKLVTEARHSEAERIRQLYVAATRAEEILVITEGASDGEYTWDDLLSEDLPYLPIPHADSSETEIVKQYIHIQQIPPVVERVKQEEKWAAHHSYIKVSPSESSIWEKFEEEYDKEIDELALQKNKIPFKGPLWGNLVHTGIECMLRDGTDAFNDKVYYEIVMKGLSQYELTDEELFSFGQIKVTSPLKNERLQVLLDHDVLHQTLQTALEQLLQNSFFQQLRGDNYSYPELPFTALLSPEEASIFSLKQVEQAEEKPMIINGIIDLVLQSKTDNRIFTLVDYKTDYIRKDESKDAFHQRLKAAYTHQLRAYETVIEQIFQKDSHVTLYIYALQTNEFIEIT